MYLSLSVKSTLCTLNTQPRSPNLNPLRYTSSHGVIRCISDFQKLCVSKTAGFRVKATSTGTSLCYPVYVFIVFHLVKQSAKPLGFLLEYEILSKLLI